MNVNHLPRWIWASATKHFDDRRQGLPMFIEGHDRITNPQDGIEFRLNGPDICEASRECFIVDLEINVLITSIKDEKDAHKMMRNIGIVLAAFTGEIPVFQFGNGVDDDRTVLVGCLILQTQDRERLIVTNFGQVQGTNNILQSTVEGHYKMTLT